MTQTPRDEEELPSFSVQVASQLGGVRGIAESSIPVIVFVVVNIVASLQPALIAAVGVAVAIAIFRLLRRQSVRHALNGLFGIGIGALIAYRTGEAKDFYIYGIWLNLAYAVAMVGSVVAARPLVGWLWSLVADGGGDRWRLDEGLRRIFSWLTFVWATVFLAKFVVNMWVYLAEGLSDDQKASILGVMRIALGAPPYALLLLLTVWTVRRYQRTITAQPA
jgi:hypothetical protein